MHINITKDDFDVNAELYKFNQNISNHGAVSIFLGKVRSEQDLKSMQIDCYPEMAQKEVRNIAEISSAKWSLDSVTIVHRYGLLKPNDNIVLSLIHI